MRFYSRVVVRILLERIAAVKIRSSTSADKSDGKRGVNEYLLYESPSQGPRVAQPHTR